MPNRILQWINERWPLGPFIRWSLEEKIPGGASFFYTDGSSILTVFTLQAVTGIMQLFFYVPSIDHAYDSISFLRTEVPFGWLIHGMHFWGADLMIVMVTIHMTRAFIWGAYKKPRELTWLMGVLLVMTVMGFSFTGGPLHWDQHGYWAGEVGTSIAGTTPVFGDIAKRMLRGGEEMGPFTLSRFFTLHTTILPATLAPLFLIHFIAFRRYGAVGPWYKWKTAFGNLWPDQIYRDTIVSSGILFLMITLCVFFPPSYSGPADTLDTTYVPKPEWNFLFLYEALKYFEGPLEPLGSVGIPGLIFSLLVLLPFIDRGSERSPLKRPLAMLCGLVFAGSLLVLTIKGYLSPGFAQMQAPASVAPSVAQPSEPSVERPEQAGKNGRRIPEGLPGRAADIIGSVERGKILYDVNCASCHGPMGAGTGIAPALKPVASDLFSKEPRVFAGSIDRFIQHGSRPAGPDAGAEMPAFGDTGALTQQEISNIEAYVMDLNGVDRAALIDPGMQPRHFFYLVTFVYVMVILVQGGIRTRRDIE